MKTRMLFVFISLFTIAPSVLGSIPKERRDLAAFTGGKSECEAKIKAIDQDANLDSAQAVAKAAKAKTVK
jgi:hypothetical protein